MDNPLTRGAIKEMLLNPKNQLKNPILQVLGLKKVSISHGNDSTERYRLILSDSVHFHPCVMLAKQLNYMVCDKNLDVQAIIRLDKYICDNIQESGKVFIILVEVTVLRKGLGSSRYGDPVQFDEKADGSSSNIQNNRPSVLQSSGNVNENQQYSGGSEFESNHGPVSQSQNRAAIFSIKGLNPYRSRWTIRARVTSKSNTREWSNAKGEGRLFSVDLIDGSGEIRATCFNDLVDKFYRLLEQNKVYYISNGKLGLANRTYSSIDNVYELTFSKETEIELCTEDCNVPTLKFNFREIVEVREAQPDAVLDVIGVCTCISMLSEVTTKSDKQVCKRDITLVDHTADVKCTLWEKDAKKLDQYVGSNPIVAIKGAKVSDYDGRSLSFLPSSVIYFNPDNLKEALNLRGWYDTLRSSVNTTPPSNERMKEKTSNPEVQWIGRSIKHASKLSKFAKTLKNEPSKVQRFGTYSVCFDDMFCIGRGGYGTRVYVGLSDDGYEVAIKRLNLEECQQIGDNEKNILNSPNVRKEKHVINYRFYQPIDSAKACLVLDLHEESLLDYVKSKERPVEQLLKEGPEIIRQILYGVKSLHCSDPEILHRDIKPSNILVNLEGEMVLADFGISRTLPKDQTTYRSGVRGTEGWMAVESLLTEDDEDDADILVRYKKQSDIQVIGMLCYYILTKGNHPYGKRYYQTGNIANGKFDLKDLSDACAKDLITWMLQHDLRKRPTVHECLKHPYLRTPEENFNFLARVGNEREIKENDRGSIVVQELNELPGLTSWNTMIDACVMVYMLGPRRTAYTNNVAGLLRFIRNMAAHWCDKTRPADVENAVVRPLKYFEKIFPTLPVDLHRIIRGHSHWTTREELKEFF